MGGIPARIWLKYDDGSDSGHFLFGSTTDTRFPHGVYEIGDDENPIWNDHLNDIPYYIETPYYDCGAMHTVKRFHFVVIDFDNYNGGVTVTWTVDGIRTGEFVAHVPVDRTSAYGSITDFPSVYTDSAESAENGGYYTETKAYSLTFRLPQECRGKKIKFRLACNASGNAPAEINVTHIGVEDLKQLYPQGTR